MKDVVCDPVLYFFHLAALVACSLLWQRRPAVNYPIWHQWPRCVERSNCSECPNGVQASEIIRVPRRVIASSLSLCTLYLTIRSNSAATSVEYRASALLMSEDRREGSGCASASKGTPADHFKSTAPN